MRRQKSRVSGKRFLFIWSAIDVKKYEVLALKASFTRGELGFDSLSKGSSQILLEQTSHPCGSRTVVSSGVGTPGIAIQACDIRRAEPRRIVVQRTEAENKEIPQQIPIPLEHHINSKLSNIIRKDGKHPQLQDNFTLVMICGKILVRL
jgi:hypothetical protein